MHTLAHTCTLHVLSSYTPAHEYLHAGSGPALVGTCELMCPVAERKRREVSRGGGGGSCRRDGVGGFGWGGERVCDGGGGGGGPWRWDGAKGGLDGVCVRGRTVDAGVPLEH